MERARLRRVPFRAMARTASPDIRPGDEGQAPIDAASLAADSRPLPSSDHRSKRRGQLRKSAAATAEGANGRAALLVAMLVAASAAVYRFMLCRATLAVERGAQGTSSGVGPQSRRRLAAGNGEDGGEDGDADSACRQLAAIEAAALRDVLVDAYVDHLRANYVGSGMGELEATMRAVEEATVVSDDALKETRAWVVALGNSEELSRKIQEELVMPADAEMRALTGDQLEVGETFLSAPFSPESGGPSRGYYETRQAGWLSSGLSPLDLDSVNPPADSEWGKAISDRLEKNISREAQRLAVIHMGQHTRSARDKVARSWFPTDKELEKSIRKLLISSGAEAFEAVVAAQLLASPALRLFAKGLEKQEQSALWGVTAAQEVTMLSEKENWSHEEFERKLKERLGTPPPPSWDVGPSDELLVWIGQTVLGAQVAEAEETEAPSRATAPDGPDATPSRASPDESSEGTQGLRDPQMPAQAATADRQESASVVSQGMEQAFTRAELNALEVLMPDLRAVVQQALSTVEEAPTAEETADQIKVVVFYTVGEREFIRAHERQVKITARHPLAEEQ
ncbi:hypothetical protein BESB_026640 [Besnoitia besnoiti]|uniref:Transmembrane protein n=1 Tax=Besnoitia besnoiti TaxID=94643 RepID=A0A2A9M8I0_BESBE|nr:uncharacterized protein BESB_026640 [Besnoitia besnoiti]PFH31690.1 hypothetical protein BESB_026640 [Besnoitia besnoiti]